MGIYWATAGILAAYLILVWFLGTWLHLEDSHLWILRGGLAAIGLVAAGVFLWFHRKSAAAQSSGEGDSGAAVTADVDLLVHEAVRRLRNSALGRGASIGNLPVIFFLGESGSTKTTTIIQSALDAELLAGHVYRDNEILPTRVSNVWYSREAVFVDPAGDLMSQATRWKRLIKLVQPGRVSATFGKSHQAPRAAIVCYDCGNLLQAGASQTSISAARKLAVRLHEISQSLGISFPVYVLFTKLDRVTFFPEFARDLTKEEATEVLGVTLPVRAGLSGVYAEEETSRLTKAFDELFYSLAEKRLDLLGRENESEKLPGIYEFPRELRKLRALIVQFLVDLGRPSHLAVNPFLRGFYFTGVRPVIVDDVVQATPQARPAESGFDGGATRIFTGDEGRLTTAPTPARVAGSRKVPQWVFLTQLFNSVIVKDRVALATSGFSTRVSLLRRIALITVAVIGAVCAIGFVVSYLGNRELLSDVKQAQALEFSAPQNTQSPSALELQQLENTGRLVDTLSDYYQNGATVSLRWGLSSRDDFYNLYSQACSGYARGLNQLILNPTRASMAASLSSLPPYRSANSATDDQQAFNNAYITLKTYLITTDYGSHAKDDPPFVADLYANWPGRQYADSQQTGLAKAQFARYVRTLSLGDTSNCFAYHSDRNAVQNAQGFLNNSPPEDRMYQAMLSHAAAKGRNGIDFAPFADGAESDSRDVPAQFTKAGWNAMMEAFQNPNLYITGDKWVLGDQAQGAADPASYVPKLRERYRHEFTNQWLQFLEAARFSGYRSPADISQKLETVAGGRSALLMVLCLTAENTAVDKDIAAAFSDASGLVSAADCEASVRGTKNEKYTAALFNLKTCLDTIRPDMPADDKQKAIKDCDTQRIAAKETVDQLVSENERTNSPANGAVERILSRPIDDPLIIVVLKPPAPPGAGDLCAGVKRLAADFPNAGPAFDELQNLFKPGGQLDQFPPPKEPNRQYKSFFDRAKAIQSALYPDGKTLQLHYSITAIPSTGVDAFALAVGNPSRAQSLNLFNERKDFIWTGDPQDSVMLRIHDLSALKTGPLAIFQFVSDSEEDGQLSVSSYSFKVELKQQLGHQTTSEQTLKLSINAGAASVLFSRGSLANLGCVAKMEQ
jgi:type VI secretion system protein ImpL